MSDQVTELSPHRSWPRQHKFLAFLLAVAGVVVVVIIASVATGPSTISGTGSGGLPSSASSSGTATPGIGTTARDGKFQFVIKDVSHARSDGMGGQAQGRFTLLHVTVTNIGTEAQSLDDSAKFVFDAAGRKFTAGTMAGIGLNAAGQAPFLENINPANSVSGIIAFDLLKGDRAVKVELHDSEFSGGVTVRLYP